MSCRAQAEYAERDRKKLQAWNGYDLRATLPAGSVHPLRAITDGPYPWSCPWAGSAAADGWWAGLVTVNPAAPTPCCSVSMPGVRARWSACMAVRSTPDLVAPRPRVSAGC
ncbi:hypothetical protein GCM10018781_77590 [Kitasatospora indigofera]|uniref:Uncharacterized protein n=1 Tax=Kitasatospora indigofera TaxID=67307 RepID=A0A919D8Z9_9ACTN|nr:hypothetical protein GCM10018781_77590 [Kitasatospora indigofera]